MLERHQKRMLARKNVQLRQSTITIAREGPWLRPKSLPPAHADTEIVRGLFDFLVRNYAGPSDLFLDSPFGWRRSFASFATQTYLMLACYNYHGAFGDERALRLANACARKLISLQGPQGEWPWFYRVPTGKVVDFYEVYSVHQDSMAPAWLEHAERHGVAGATEAIVRGFEWILGNNQRGQSMLRPALGMIVRSHARKGNSITSHRGS